MTDKKQKEEVPEEEPKTVPEDAQEEAPATDPAEETKEEEKSEETEPEVPKVHICRITNHRNGQVIVSKDQVRLSTFKAIATLGAKGYVDLLQVCKTNGIKPGNTWEGTLDDLKGAPKKKKK